MMGSGGGGAIVRKVGGELRQREAGSGAADQRGAAGLVLSHGAYFFLYGRHGRAEILPPRTFSCCAAAAVDPTTGVLVVPHAAEDIVGVLTTCLIVAVELRGWTEPPAPSRCLPLGGRSGQRSSLQLVVVHRLSPPRSARWAPAPSARQRTRG